MTTNKLAWTIVGAVAVIIIVIVLVVVLGKGKNKLSSDVNIKTGQLCYYSFEKTDRGLSDVSWITMNLEGQQATGELRILPAEKDSKVGTFSGTVTDLDQSTMSRTLDAAWNASAEGSTVVEELRVVFGEGMAYVGFGEMVDRGNGLYGYKDTSALTYGKGMSQVGCDDLRERVAVEEYVRSEIGGISPVKPVAGGSWYVTALSVDPLSNTGHVSYEDGHVQEESSFGYTYDGSLVTAVEFFDTK